MRGVRHRVVVPPHAGGHAQRRGDAERVLDEERQQRLRPLDARIDEALRVGQDAHVARNVGDASGSRPTGRTVRPSRSTVYDAARARARSDVEGGAQQVAADLHRMPADDSGL